MANNLMRLLGAGCAGLALVSAAYAAPEPLTFLRDVSPIMNKAGCSSGPCHGSAKGKNGFKLSLRGYDPEFDYEAFVQDLSGRRFNRAVPAKSLILVKPTMEVAHGGGLRFTKNSRQYKTIHDWISQGAIYGQPAKDAVTGVTVEPKEIRMNKAGEVASVKVTAVYADGATREVTEDATVESNTPDVALVSDGHNIKGERTGEAAVLVRFQGKMTVIPVTVLTEKTGYTFPVVAKHNFIDEAIDAKLQKVKLQPSPLVDDAGFLRRVSLDLTGQAPTVAEIRAFLADPTPTRAKRAKKIDDLLARPSYVDHWTVKWSDLLQNNSKYLGEKGAYGFQEFLRSSIERNKPYDKFVKELLLASGSSYDNPAANFFRVSPDAKLTMERTTQVFLGVRMVCAQCHDHPFERWTQNQYFQMAAFFSAVGVRPGYEVGEEIIYDRRNEFEMKHPKDGRVMPPQFMVASATPIAIPSGERRRDALATWLVSKENPFFAKAVVNRMWSYFFGKGIIDPVDDMRASNPPSNPQLLDALTKDFIDHQFDLKHLLRTIANSRAYQSSIVPNAWNSWDNINFSHQAPRRLSAEQLQDAVVAATGAPVVFPGAPPETTAAQVVDPHVGKEGFLDLFGRPSRESACECERRTDFSLPQALNLVNGNVLSEAVADGRGRVAKLILSGATDKALVEELYLASLGRMPTAAEAGSATTYLQGDGGRARRAQDLLWALLNSKAFLFNH